MPRAVRLSRGPGNQLSVVVRAVRAVDFQSGARRGRVPARDPRPVPASAGPGFSEANMTRAYEFLPAYLSNTRSSAIDQ